MAMKLKSLLGTITMALVGVSVFLMACASEAPTATPVQPAQPAPPVAPTAAPAAAPTVASGAPAPTAAVPTPTVARLLPTPTPVVTTGKPTYGGNLRWGGAYGVATLDPISARVNPERPNMWALYNTLVAYGADFGIQPSLAESWQVSADGKSLTFKLRTGVKFHDGTEFNAQAVKFNFDRVLNPNNFATQRTLWTDVLLGVDVVDQNTVTFRIKDRFRPFLAQLADVYNNVGMASPTAVAKYGDKYASNPVGTGAYKLQEWRYGDRILMVANRDYWEKGPPYLDQITALSIPDSNTRIAMLRTGEVEIEDQILPTQLEVIQKNPNLKMVSYNSCRFYGLYMVVDRAPWNNKALRQAVAYGVDRKRLVNVLAQGQGRPGYSPGGDCFWWSNPGLKVYDYDPVKAKDKLKEAGFPNGIEVNYWVPSSTDFLQEAEVYQAILSEVGIKLKVNQVPNIGTIRIVQELNAQFGATNFVPRADPHGQLQVLFHSTGGANFAKYNNPEVDRLLDQAVTLYDQAETKKLYDQVQQIIVEDVAGRALVTYFRTEFTGMSSRVQNYVDIPDRMLRFKDLWMRQ